MESKRFQELVLPQWQGEFKMTILENVLKDNKEFVENFEGTEMSHHAAKKLAILTCMDCRLIDFFEPALGLKRGDAKIVRNAGNSIVGEDAIRSIGAALYNLGAEEVISGRRATRVRPGAAAVFMRILSWAEPDQMELAIALIICS